MNSIWAKQKRMVMDAAREMSALGLVTGTSGNVSMRIAPTDELGDMVAITPSGKPYGTLIEDDIVIVDYDIESIEGDLVPSSETLLHLEIYKARPDVEAVIHTHSVYSSVFAVVGMDIPPIIDEMMVLIGGAIKVSDYAFPGSEELAKNVCQAIGERNAALISHHGAVGAGRSLREALDVCALIERVAQIYHHASMMGKVETLPDEIIEAELAIYRMRRGGGDA